MGEKILRVGKTPYKYMSRFWAGFLITILMLAVIGCKTDNHSATNKEPIKIGVLLPYTGVFASLGTNITRGMELYLDEVGWQVSGRNIVLFKEDSEGNGQTGLMKAHRLIENRKVDLVTGIVSSTVAYAIRNYVVSQRIPLIISNAGASDLTRDKRSPFIFRVSFCNGQYEYPLGKYAYEELKLRKVVILAPDYAAGHEKAIGFMQGFKDAGGVIVQELYPPLGTTDYGPYLTRITQADAAWAHFSGTDAIRFVKQYQDYGLKEKMKLLSSGDMVDESFLPSQGDAAIGIISSLHYSAALNTPQNISFVRSYTKKYGEEPNMFAEQGYVSARVIVEALKKSNPGNTNEFLNELAKVSFEAPRGPFRFDPQTQNVIFNTYIRKTEKRNGKLMNTVIMTIPEVSDRWQPDK